MRCLLIITAVVFLLSFATYSSAQTTAITATVTDSDSVVWNNFSYTITFQPIPGYSGKYTYQGTTFVPQQFTGNANSSGQMSVTIPDNSFIFPSGTQWQFVLQPFASGQSTQFTLSVTGANQNFTSFFSNGVKPPRFSASGTTWGYSDVEISPTPNPGGSYYSVTQNCTRVWNSATLVFACTGGGGGGGCSAGGNLGDFQKNNGSGGCVAGALNDNGTVVVNIEPLNQNAQLNQNANARFKGPNPYTDVSAFGARFIFNSDQLLNGGFTANIAAGTNTATVTTSTIQNNDWVLIRGAGASQSMSTPAAPGVASAVNTGPTGTGNFIAIAEGASTYCVKIRAVDKGHGYTAASAATCISNGDASFGAHTLAYTGSALAGPTLTTTTAARSPEILAATQQIRINGQWMSIATLPNNTSITATINVDTRNGGTATAFGSSGTIYYWDELAITVPTPTLPVWKYLIYLSTAGAGGPYSLIGITNPTAPGTTDSGYYTFEYYGTTISGSPTVPLWAPPSDVAGASNDDLSAQVTAGGLSPNLTLSANAGSGGGFCNTGTCSAATILLDGGPPIVNAATQSIFPNNGGMVYVPTGSPLTVLPIQSYVDLAAVSGSGNGVVVSQAGALYLNDSINVGNTLWKGDLTSTQVKTSLFSFTKGVQTFVNTAFPAVVTFGTINFSGVQFSNPANMYEDILIVGNGALPTGLVQNVGVGLTGAAGGDYMGTPFVVTAAANSGSAGLLFRDFSITVGPAQTVGSTATPLFSILGFGEVTLQNYMFNRRGIFEKVGSTSGVVLTAESNFERQGGITPQFTFMPSVGGGGFTAKIKNHIQDTEAETLVSNLTGVSGITSNAILILDSFGAVSGYPFSYISDPSTNATGTGGIIQNVRTNTVQTGPAIDGVYSSTVSGGTNSKMYLNELLTMGQSYSAFADAPQMAAPVVTAVAGGSMAPGTYTVSVAPDFYNGSVLTEGTVSPASAPVTISNTCPGSGNCSLSITWAKAAGATNYDLFLGNNFFSNTLGLYTGLSTTLTTSSVSGATAPTITGGGPTGFNTNGLWTPLISLSPSLSVPPHVANTGQLYMDPVTNKVGCLTNFGNNCFGLKTPNSYSANHTLNINEDSATATATLTFTLPHAVNNWAWDIESVSGTTTLSIDSGNLYVGGAIGSIVIPNSQGVRAWCDGTNCYAFGLGSGGGGGSPGGFINAVQMNNGSGGFSAANSPVTNGIYNFVANVTANASVAGSYVLPGIPVNAQTGTTYTIGAANTFNDRGTVIKANNAGAQTYTAVNPSSTGFGFNMFYSIWNVGTGAVTENSSGFNINGGTSLFIPPNWVSPHWSDGVNYFAARYPDFLAFPNCTGGGNALQFTVSTGLFACGSASAGVSSVTGDTGLFCNSTSTGAVTLVPCTTTLAHKFWGNNTGSTGTAAFVTIGEADLPATTVFTDKTATFGAFLYDFSASTMKIPTAAGFTSSASSMLGYDSTAKNCHVEANNADAICGAFAAASPPSNKQVVQATVSSNNVLLTGLDYPDVQVIPAANCNNTTPGSGWSIGSGGTVTCRAGTNNKGGFISITDTSTTFATFQTVIPEDWDSGTNPFIRFQLASTDAVNSHTIIPSIQVACYKGDGSTTDDVAPNAAHSLSTTTLNGNANRFWSTSNVQMNATDMTGCVAGALMQVTVGRATDTATNAEFYSATLTFPRLITVQAN